jgi:serine/threonine protein kinase
VDKSLEKSILIKRKQVKHTLTEKKVLQQFKGHPFIVQMYTCFQTKTKLNFVLEYCQGGELFYQLQKQKNQKFNEEKVVFYAAEVLVALASLHAKGIIYRDLKPENVLLDTKGHIKLADFGFAKEKMFFPQKTFSFCGSPEYLSPEMIKRKGHGMETDMWSFGCFCYELLTGNPPFQNENMYRLFTAIEQGHVWYPPDLSGIVISLLKNLLVVNPNQRLTAEEAMKHDFFQQIDWEQLYAKKLVPPIQPNVSSHECTQNFDDGFTLEPVAPLDYCSIIKFQQKENNNYSNNINRKNNDNDCKRWKTNRNSSSSNSDINRNSNSKSNNSSMDTNDNYLEDLFDEF